MKNIISIIILVLSISFSTNAQRTPVGSVNYNSNLDKFEGTWKWNNPNSNEEMILKLKKVMYYWDLPAGFYEEVLLSCHRYMKNGIVIEDNLSLFPTLGQNQTGDAILYESRTANDITGVFKDLLLNKNETLEITYNQANTPFLNWYLHKGSVPYKIGQTPPDISTTLPRDLILLKQP